MMCVLDEHFSSGIGDGVVDSSVDDPVDDPVDGDLPVGVRTAHGLVRSDLPVRGVVHNLDSDGDPPVDGDHHVPAGDDHHHIRVVGWPSTQQPMRRAKWRSNKFKYKQINFPSLIVLKYINLNH